MSTNKRLEYRFDEEDGGPYWVEYTVDMHGRPHGVKRSYDLTIGNEPGRCVMQYTYRHGILHGWYVRYHKDSDVMKEEGFFCSGRRCGPMTTYYESSAVETTCFYEHGLLEDQSVVWYENGQPMIRMFFKADKFSRKYEYDSAGKLQEIVDYEDDGVEYKKKTTYERVKKICYTTTIDYRTGRVTFGKINRQGTSI